MKKIFAIAWSLTALGGAIEATASEHPSLVMTQSGAEKIRAALGNVPLFDATLATVQAQVDAQIEQGIDTPLPKDFSGGHTHSQHKQNFFMAQKAGLLFQILEDQKYANYVRDMLFQYEAMYNDLPLHPQTRSYARGKLFWQCLNDSNWLVYMSQAYDLIYNELTPDERERLENNLFRPFADFISLENPQFYNRIHNHSTWGNAAVGMIGLVMDDDELIQRALHGIEDDGLEIGTKDNDGGFIKVAGQKAGFLANLEQPFSPDGYYTEGPYYQRYAMYPFLVFAQGLNNVRPDLEIFKYKDGVLLNAVAALLNLSDAQGEFFALNDGQKGMSVNAAAVVSAVNVAYLFGDQDPQLLSIAEEQGQVLLDDSGFAVALAVSQGKAKPFQKASVNLSDGADGKQGGVAVLRQNDEALSLVFKYTSQGLSHGHYDKLSFSLHEAGEEILQDYGLVRFVNVEQKGGGNYLPENKTWAKQTIAHNTLTQDETSHFQGKYEIGSKHHSNLYFYDDRRDDIQVVSATESNAYPGTDMRRTMALITHESFNKPVLLDILKVASDKKHQYDLPFYFFGQVLDTNFDYSVPKRLETLGDKNGYQHLYVEAEGSAPDGNTQFAWMSNQKFYTLTSVTEAKDELKLTRIGANDPDFNLRRDPAFMIRRNDADDALFVSVVEPHGNYSPVAERATDARSHIAKLQVVYDATDYTAVSIEDVDGKTSVFVMANTDASFDTKHKIRVGNHTYTWTGPYDLQ
ncbi:MAG: alginate lyase family protein [Gammaproteobacteria bacterium]